MSQRKNSTKLTNREIDVLDILWNSDIPLTAAEIAPLCDETISINAIQAVLRKLLQQEMIEVADIVHSGTVLCRNYRPTEQSRDKLLSQFSSEFHRFRNKFPVASFLSSLFEKETDPQKQKQQIKEVETFLDTYKKSHK